MKTEKSHAISLTTEQKAILIAVSDGEGGYGDFLFALKLSEQLKRQYANAELEPPPIYLVTQPTGRSTIKHLKGDIEFNVDVLTPNELKTKVNAKEIEVGLLIEAPVFQTKLIDTIDEALSNAGSRVPLIMVPEYGYNGEALRLQIDIAREYRKESCQHIEYADTIYSGFKKDADERGILLSEELVYPASASELVNQLDERIRAALSKNSDSAPYQETTELSMQYSHDIYILALSTESDPSPAAHFMQIHREFSKTSEKNQDVLMIGNSKENKRRALEGIKDKLIADGYKHISFYNSDNEEDEVLYQAEEFGKSYRVIYASGMSHASMMACTALSGPLTGATGDQSFGEVLSSNKIMVYECLGHKMDLIQNYDSAMIEASGDDPIIAETLQLLRQAKTETDYQQLGARLREPVIQERFQQINKIVLAKYDLVSDIVGADKIWEEKLRGRIAKLLQQGRLKDALDTIIEHQNRIALDDKFEGKTLMQHALDNDPKRVVKDFLSYLKNNQPNKALWYLKAFKLDPFSRFEKKTLFARVLDAGFYNCAEHIIFNSESTPSDRRKLCDVLQSKNSEGETYLAKLRREHPVDRFPATIKASLLSTLNQLAKYRPKQGSKSAEMHQAFEELAKTFTDLSSYEDKAFIGLLLFNKKNYESEYKWLSPRKGVFFGSRLYSIGEDALKNLGVNLKRITPEEEAQYHQALIAAINKKPEYIANNRILQSLSKQAGIDRFPRVQPLVTQAEAKKILSTTRTISLELDDEVDDALTFSTPTNRGATILPTLTGFYKINPEPLGAGNWGSVYAAQHFSQEGRRVIAGQPVSIKKTDRSNASSLDKEFQNFKAAYPEGYFERWDKDGYSYFIMPLFPGVQLDKYLSSHQELTTDERLVMVKEFLLNLQALHAGGITHNDLKLPNVLFDPVAKEMHLIDFGCAETHGTRLKYEDIYTSIFAFEMPPEYMKGTASKATLDVFSSTALIAEIMGVDKVELVKARMLKVFDTIHDDQLKKDMQDAFERTKNLGDAFFIPPLSNHVANPDLEKFIRQYVSEPYDFSPYQEQLGKNTISLLNAMQAPNPDDRPSLEACLEQLEGFIVSAQVTHDYKAAIKNIRDDDGIDHEDDLSVR